MSSSLRSANRKCSSEMWGFARMEKTLSNTWSPTNLERRIPTCNHGKHEPEKHSYLTLLASTSCACCACECSTSGAMLPKKLQQNPNPDRWSSTTRSTLMDQCRDKTTNALETSAEPCSVPALPGPVHVRVCERFQKTSFGRNKRHDKNMSRLRKMCCVPVYMATYLSR